MHPNQRAATQQRVLEEAGRIDTGGFFNLLTGPQLLDQSSGVRSKLMWLPELSRGLLNEPLPVR